MLGSVLGTTESLRIGSATGMPCSLQTFATGLRSWFACNMVVSICRGIKGTPPFLGGALKRTHPFTPLDCENKMEPTRHHV